MSALKKVLQKRKAIDSYSKTVSDPDRWLEVTRQLFFAADKFQPDIKQLWVEFFNVNKGNPRSADYDPDKGMYLHNTYLMLYGFGVENLIKAGIVKVHQKTIQSKTTSTGLLPGYLIGHELVKLAKKAKLTLSIDQKELLDRLETNLVWSGRYPIPLNVADAEPTVKRRRPHATLRVYWSSSDIDEIQALVEDISSQLGLTI